ncbi:uncharacterized protein LOC133638858 isoform X2 [Entelurus aequoreus]|uniref:uncharacterized protein LOC133638858 isoform X2 n=1 Tax=Entelurus aequoreus TaxID=161455 RepID=UPI002B1DF264|nr:uncharacterized protein LOC133638858 isoform X2 [Entelurus aequoreus]
MAFHLLLAMAVIMGLVDPLCASGPEQKQTEPTPVRNITSSSRYLTSSGPTRLGLTGPKGPGLRGPTGPGLTNPTRPGLTGPTRPGLTGPTRPSLTSPKSPGLTSPTSPGLTSPTRPPSIEDKLNQIHKNLENQTQNFVSEDKENFQVYEDYHPPGVCREDDLVKESHAVCTSTFYQQMEHLRPDERCVLDQVIGKVQDFFLLVHSSFFQQCSPQERPLEDAPHGLAVALTLGTVSIIPVLVYLVGWRSGVDSAR